MTSEQLHYFLSVAKYLNFTEAAKDFYVTQPAISRQISELERELGARLFYRSTRNVSLTKSGELFLEDAKRFLALEESAKERIRLADSSTKLSLKIAYLLSPCKSFLPELVNRFHSLFPQVDLSLLRKDAQGITESIPRLGVRPVFFSDT
ncbi:MAG: LysR family transcriptional regulator [Eubacterium sp.]